MAKVRMTQYPVATNSIVFPECPHALKDRDYDSKEVICGHPKRVEDYCSSLNEMGKCPFGLVTP